jgi:hypothetical protein
MPAAGEWVLLSYRLPREPSTVRVGVWRKLRRLGVAQVQDGLVALPADARTREQLEWIADEVLEASGEATVWLARPGSRAQERALAARMAEAVATDYRAMADEAREALEREPGVRARTLTRLRREFGRIRQRDFFPPAERDIAQEALDALATTVVDTSVPRSRA